MHSVARSIKILPSSTENKAVGHATYELEAASFSSEVLEKRAVVLVSNKASKYQLVSPL